MRVLRRVALVALFTFSVTPAFADDSACCEQLRKEVQVIKDQQDQLFKSLKQTEVSDKKSFSTLGNLMTVLANKFPDLKDTLNKFKDAYEHLEKSTN